MNANVTIRFFCNILFTFFNLPLQKEFWCEILLSWCTDWMEEEEICQFSTYTEKLKNNWEKAVIERCSKMVNVKDICMWLGRFCSVKGQAERWRWHLELCLESPYSPMAGPSRIPGPETSPTHDSPWWEQRLHSLPGYAQALSQVWRVRAPSRGLPTASLWKV